MEYHNKTVDDTISTLNSNLETGLS